uniref:aldehyde dehydrogenase family protein n=1 Tax=Amycolatopsis sp. VC5-11 TaxID=3120156 RepID=UPI00300BBC8C
MAERDVLYIGGEWVRSDGGASIPVENPATEQVQAHIPEGTAADVDRAVRAAREAFPAWAETSRADRRELLRKLHDGLAKRAEE